MILKIANKTIFGAIMTGNEDQYIMNLSPAKVKHPNIFPISVHDETTNLVSFNNWREYTKSSQKGIEFC